MSVSGHVHTLTEGAAELERTAQLLFGKRYLKLNDAEADAVWADIELREVYWRDYSHDRGGAGQ